MPVVIGQMDVTETAAPARSGGGGGGGEAPRGAPEDPMKKLRKEQVRRARVRAH